MRADPLMGMQQSPYTGSQPQLPPQYRMGM